MCITKNQDKRTKTNSIVVILFLLFLVFSNGHTIAIQNKRMRLLKATVGQMLMLQNELSVIVLFLHYAKMGCCM